MSRTGFLENLGARFALYSAVHRCEEQQFYEFGCSITGVGSVLHAIRSSQEHKLICASSLIVPAHSVA